MAAKQNALWDEFILWLAMPEVERGVYATEEDWAKSKGYADSRQLRRWKKDPAFIERQRVLLENMASRAGAVTQFDDDEGDSADERDYRLVKSQLLTNAKSGNLKATELFMKLYGKTWIDEEQAARSSDFSNMDLPSLLAEAAVAVSPEFFADALRSAGWLVEAPDDGSPRVS
jgi:hypothetical protein